MKEIIKDGKVVARHILESDIKEGLNFYSNDDEFIQVGAWNYDNGKRLLGHIHNEVDRNVNRTCEVLYVIKGSLEARIYDLSENLLETFVVGQGEILVLLECGHGYTILSDGTKVIEIKNGPYLGADVDRRRIEN